MSNYSLIKDSCGFLKVFPTPSKADLDNFYSQKYFQNDSGNFQKLYQEWEFKYFEDESKIIEFYTRDRKLKILDLGCGEGFQSAYFLKKGHNITCVDYSEFGLKRHNSHLTEYFIQKDILEFLKSSNDKYDLILLKNVLEHVPDSRALLEHIKTQMYKESILYIDVPNDFSAFQQFLQSRKYTENTWFVPPEHLNYFQNDSLNNLLNQMNFEIISSQAGFPIEIFLANEESNYFRDRKKGRNAHKSRCDLTNFLSSNIKTFIEFREALAKVELGRNLLRIVKLKF
jgi:2-polyprenyl-3-methyl-5-hydroxy-6-metoxy-1,4-benzoquinol methylase